MRPRSGRGGVPHRPLHDFESPNLGDSPLPGRLPSQGNRRRHQGYLIKEGVATGGTRSGCSAPRSAQSALCIPGRKKLGGSVNKTNKSIKLFSRIEKRALRNLLFENELFPFFIEFHFGTKFSHVDNTMKNQASMRRNIIFSATIEAKRMKKTAMDSVSTQTSCYRNLHDLICFYFSARVISPSKLCYPQCQKGRISIQEHRRALV